VARVTILTTGGTIASTRDPETGASVAAVSGEDLVAGVPALAEVADVSGRELARIHSWDVTPALMADIARTLTELAEGPDAPDGFVVTHGTDTMEETAFALTLLARTGDRPIVVTGAMRSADHPAPDGPGNLLDAVRVAASDELPAGVAGAVIVMNGQVHAARYVTKTHTTALDTFGSPDTGPVATLDGDGLHVRWLPAPLPPVDVATPDDTVDLVKMVSGLGARQLQHAVDDGSAGVVVEGSGSGNVHADAMVPIRALLAAGVPVVLTSRCVAGRVVAGYGGDGGGATMRAEGVILAPGLNGPKARLALATLLGGGADLDAVRAWFAGLG
jgi:L-asparaginase